MTGEDDINEIADAGLTVPAWVVRPWDASRTEIELLRYDVRRYEHDLRELAEENHDNG